MVSHTKTFNSPDSQSRRKVLYGWQWPRAPPETDEERQAEIFAVTTGVANYTFATPLATNAHKRGNNTRAKIPFLLKELVFGEDGRALTSWSSVKKKGRSADYCCLE
jgi:hypothetical protein